MHKRLLHSLGLLVAGLGITLLLLPGSGSAQDLGPNNALIKKRIEGWKAFPELRVGIDFTDAVAATTPGSGKAISIHIGIDEYSKAGYPPNGLDTLRGCKNDSITMESMAKEAGFTTESLHNDKAKRDVFLKRLDELATDPTNKLKKGDILLITFSGHGGQCTDQNGDEADNKDETWCFHDDWIIDDEFAEQWAKFDEGVRIIVFLDSCNSGTAIKAANVVKGPKVKESAQALQQRKEINAIRSQRNASLGVRNRKIPDEVVKRMEADPVVGKKIKARGAAATRQSVSEGKTKATVVLFAATLDGTSAQEVNGQGVFTQQVKLNWDNRFKTQGTYGEFFDAIRVSQDSHIKENGLDPQHAARDEVGKGTSDFRNVRLFKP
jgi:metacaspase-1